MILNLEEEVMISIIGLLSMSLWTITMVGGLHMASVTTMCAAEEHVLAAFSGAV